MDEPDPHPKKDRFVGQQCSFDGPDGKTWSGLILEQTWIGYTERGRIPNYRLKVQGLTGRTVDVDMTEQHCLLKP